MHNLKLGLLRAASSIPGSVGEEATTRFLRRRRSAAGVDAVHRFDVLLGALSEDSLCLDLGANVGEFTEKLAAKAGHVHAFEPDPWTFEQLKERVGHLPNVTLYQAAIGVEDGTIELRRPPEFENDPKTASVGCSIVAGADDTWSTVPVKMVGFSGFLKGLNRRIDIVKMDIEGAEVDVLEHFLKSPLLTAVDAMFVETHEVNMAELRERIEKLRQAVSFLEKPEINLDWP
ncbi:FkbM family methyltransferase [uncultured Roseibium sp.]|uniref:FkbM family methyltransferase n=1 Tax=uncultured Roseibium sp. TaxID=1936171 RepID=UPI0026057981|nr:FkbM family methyltransferase [uncultured Roseibium sp.]